MFRYEDVWLSAKEVNDRLKNVALMPVRDIILQNMRNAIGGSNNTEKKDVQTR